MSKDFEVVEFQKNYSILDIRFEKVDKELFDLGILVAYTSELNNGFMVKRQLKTTNKGTKFNYKQIENQEELDNYNSKLKEMVTKLNPKLTIEKLKSKIEQLEV